MKLNDGLTEKYIEIREVLNDIDDARALIHSKEEFVSDAMRRVRSLIFESTNPQLVTDDEAECPVCGTWAKKEDSDG